MAGIDNLKVPTSEQAREYGQKGGLASVESKRRKREIREYMQGLLDSVVSKDKDGKEIIGAEAMAMRVFKAALGGDWKAWELARDTAGQKPIEKIMVADVDAEVVEQIENMVLGK
jgi:hypothetical protein